MTILDALGLLLAGAVVGSLVALILWWGFRSEYHKEPNHRRPDELKPWHVVPDTRVPARHRRETMEGDTTKLDYPRARQVGYPKFVPAATIPTREVVSRGQGPHRAGPEGRVRRAQALRAHEEVGRSDRERGHDTREAKPHGEESGAHPQTARQIASQEQIGMKMVTRFQNRESGEITLLDSDGRVVDWKG